MNLPESVKFVIMGDEIHGLSRAGHLAKDLKTSGKASESLGSRLWLCPKLLQNPLYGVPLIEQGHHGDLKTAKKVKGYSPRKQPFT